MHPSPTMPVVWQSHDMNLTFPVLHPGDVAKVFEDVGDLLFLMEVLGGKLTMWPMFAST